MSELHTLQVLSMLGYKPLCLCNLRLDYLDLGHTCRTLNPWGFNIQAYSKYTCYSKGSAPWASSEPSPPGLSNPLLSCRLSAITGSAHELGHKGGQVTSRKLKCLCKTLEIFPLSPLALPLLGSQPLEYYHHTLDHPGFRTNKTAPEQLGHPRTQATAWDFML
jgi:hypothetical protein